MKLKRFYLKSMALFVFLLMFSSVCFAKDKDISLRLLAKYDGTKILFRWVPSDMSMGYTYRLAKVTKNGEQTMGEYRMVSLPDITKKYSKEEAALLIPLLYPQSLYKTDTEKLQAVSQKENQKGMAFYMAELKPRLAEAMGIRAEDSKVEQGKVYAYIVRVMKNEKEVFNKSISVSTHGKTKLYPPVATAIRYEWGSALRWTNFDFYSAFNVYRSSNRTGTYERINKSPVNVNFIKKKNGLVETAPYFYSDTSEGAKKPAYYKVTGIDSFGDESNLSAAEFAVRDGSIRPKPQMPVSTEVIEPVIKITWEQDPAQNIAGYNLYRSSQYNGDYIKLNQKPLKKDSYTDRNAKYYTNYFYCHSAVDNIGKESVLSLPRLAVLRDRTPPGIPQNFLAMAREGVVELRWLAVTDQDLKGYEIYRALKPDAPDWAMLNKGDIKRTFYIDTMSGVLDKKPYFYKVLAKDNEANRSDFSDIIKIKLPDVTPPPIPVWKGSSNKNSTITLEWRTSSAKDTAGYKLYRGRGNKRALIAELSETELSYTDTGVKPGDKAWYFLTAVDGDLNESEMSSSFMVKNQDITPLSLKNITLSSTNDGVLLKLNLIEKDFSSMSVHRKNEKQASFKKVISGHMSETWLDKYVDKNKTYIYKVTAYDRTGNATTSKTHDISVAQ